MNSYPDFTGTRGTRIKSDNGGLVEAPGRSDYDSA